MSKQYLYIRLENVEKYEGWDLVEIIPAKFERHYDMAVVCKEETHKSDDLHGKWITLEAEIGLYSCSKCEYRILREKCNFCPNCGAKMDGKDGAK